MTLPPLDPRFVRRIALLCCHFTRNVAYYRIGYVNETGTGKLKQMTEFGATVNGNMIDIAVLEWCKLFADKKAHQHWRKFVRTNEEQQQFLTDLFQIIDINVANWHRYLDGFRVYRDKFVAHLDQEDEAHIPELEMALQSTFFLYSYLLAHAPTGTFDMAHRVALPRDLPTYYAACQKDARVIYASLL